MNNKEIEQIYQQISLDDLIVFAMCNVLQTKEDCTFERLVYECFMQFPKSFSFSRYPDWPDSNKLDRPLRKLRERGIIIGNPKIGFILTEHGYKLAENVGRRLNIPIKSQPKGYKNLKGKENNFIAYLKSSELYHRFSKEQKNFSLNQSELINLLRGTLETPLRVLRQNLIYYKQIAADCGEKELQEFLSVVEERLSEKP